MPGREDLVGRPAGDGHHVRDAAFGEDDRRPVERDQAAQLADEGAERLVEVERRRECPRAAAGRFEQVDAAGELIAQVLGLGGLCARDRGLPAQTSDQPADDHAGDQQEPERERDAVEDEVRGPEPVARATTRGTRAAAGAGRERRRRPEARSGAPPRRRERRAPSEPAAVLEAEEERVEADDRGVEGQRERAEAHRVGPRPVLLARKSSTAPAAKTAARIQASRS